MPTVATSSHFLSNYLCLVLVDSCPWLKEITAYDSTHKHTDLPLPGAKRLTGRKTWNIKNYMYIYVYIRIYISISIYHDYVNMYIQNIPK